MAILYDRYNLQNSTQIPTFVGSVLPELQQTAGVLQERFDFTKNQMDALDYAMKNSVRSDFDRKVYEDLIGEYRGKLSELAKGNPEDMTRQSAMMVRDYTGRYKHIADNYAAVSKFMNDEAERFSKGKLNKQMYEANLRRIQDTYTGLKYDPTTGQYTNKFSERGIMEAPDMIEKINKILDGANPKVRGWKVEGMSGDNEFVVNQGGETKILTWDQIKGFIGNAIEADPELSSYRRQLSELAPYMHGYTERLTDASAARVLEEAPNYDQNTSDYVIGQIALENTKKGMSPKQALKAAMSQFEDSRWMQTLYNYGRKGVVDEHKTSSSRILSSYGTAKRSKQNAILSVAMVGMGSGGLDNPADLITTRNNQLETADRLQKDYMSWVQGNPKAGQSKVNIEYDKDLKPIRAWRTTADGKQQDVTQEYFTRTREIEAAKQSVKDLEEIDIEAQKASGFRIDPGLAKEARKIYEWKFSEEMKAAQLAEKMRAFTPEQKEKATERARKIASEFQNEYIRQSVKNIPGYNNYLAKIKEFTDKNAESESVVLINDAEVKKTWNEALTALNSGMGKDGAMAFTYASGAKKGEQLSGSDYKDIEGKFEVVGFAKDDNGRTKMVVKVNDEVKNSKVKGKNLLVNMTDFNADDWLRTEWGQENFDRFEELGKLKAKLNNSAKRTEWEIGIDPISKQVIKAPIWKEGAYWKIAIPTLEGSIIRTVSSHDGLLNEIEQARQK